MANEYYSDSGAPATGAALTSAEIRAEFAAIELGADKLPVLLGNGSKIVAVNSAATALESVAVTGTGSVVRATSPTLVTPVLGVASATSLATSAASPLLLTNGQLATVALTSQTVGATTLTIPDFAGVVDEFTFKTKAQTLSNKTFVAPALGTPASGVATNLTGTAAGLTAGNVTTNANLTGHVTSVGNAAVLGSFTVAQLNTAISDGNILPLAGGTMTGGITMSGASVFDANASIAAHATTMNPWSLGNYVTCTGAAVTFTAMANAPQAGAEVELYMNAAHIFTDGAVFEVDGDANFTATAGDRVVLRAKSTTVFTVHPRKKDGTAVAVAATATNITLGTAQASTSGTSIDFTGIPAGTKRIKVMFVGVSTNGTSNFLIQLGDAGGFETTGYIAVGSTNGTTVDTSTAGFILSGTTAAAATSNGTATLDLEESALFSWAISGNIARSDSVLNTFAGSKSTSAELTQVRITTVNGTDAFDAGKINIAYE